MFSHNITLDGDDDNVDESKMEIRIETDKFGEPMKFQVFEGHNYIPMYHRATLDLIKDVELKEDDIYLCAFPRTGTHWTFELVNMLLNGNAETVQKSKAKMQLEFTRNTQLKLLTSPRMINTHFQLQEAPRDLTKKKCKIIYNLRDPRDVAVSMYHAYLGLIVSGYKGTFEGFLGFFLDGKVEAGGIFEHWRNSEKFFKENPDIPVHFQIYEETHKDPIKEVQQLSDFLGLPRNDDLCRAIAEKCKFKNMVVDKDPYAIKVDGKNALYRKGEIGDWKNYFSDEMMEEYFRVYEDKMAGSRFYERYARHQ